MTRLIFWILATCLVYTLNKQLYRRYNRIWLSPILITPLVIGAAVLLSGLTYDAYLRDTRPLLWMVGPATISMAVPVYQHRTFVRTWWPVLACGTGVATLTALLTAAALAHCFGLPADVTHSLMARSISLPFAFAVADELKGTQDLTTLFVVMSGLFGLVCGELALTFMPVRTEQARGASLGAIAHSIGALKALEHGPARGVMASLTMIFSGALTVLLAPCVNRLATLLLH
jgi:putative effector of murein hydrolase